MKKDVTSFEKRSSVKKNYDLIAKQYSEDFGTFIEEMVDEPYLNENGKNVLYMSYQTNDEIKNLIDSFSYSELYRKEKIETSEFAINSNDVTTVFILVKKIKPM